MTFGINILLFLDLISKLRNSANKRKSTSPKTTIYMDEGVHRHYNVLL